MNQFQFEEAIQAIEPGMYQHFKGNYYDVLYIARHSESTEPMVVYRALYGDGGVWVRPAYMWTETVEHDGHAVARFRKVSQEERISFYEALFDEVKAAGDSRTNEMDQKLKMLDDYYTSGQWLDDYEADEHGLLPDDLKRGVLSQDALYDLFQ